MRWTVWLTCVWGLWGCAPGEPPLVEAHRAGAGYWPENSSYGLRQAMAQGYDGIEVDVVLTRDLVPVLHHDPSVSTEHCRTADGGEVPADTLIRDLSLEELQAGYVCGGLPLDEFDQAVVRAEPIATLAEMIGLLREVAPADQLIHLDIKQEPGLTLPPSVFAEQVLTPWYEAELPQPMHVSSNLPAVLAAFRDEAGLHGRSLETTLIWPRFPVGASTSAVALQREGALLSGKEDYVALADEAGADNLALNWELASKHLATVAHREGVGIMLWTPNDPAVLHRLARRWPVDVLITDFPGEAP